MLAEPDQTRQPGAMDEIATQLRLARKRAKLSQPALAKRAHLDQGFISKIESHKATPSVETIQRWLRGCDARFVAAPQEMADPAEIEMLEEPHRELLLRLARVLPALPSELADDLSNRVTWWAERYLSSDPPTSQDSAASSNQDIAAKSS